jgi:hypothetical protein
MKKRILILSILILCLMASCKPALVQSPTEESSPQETESLPYPEFTPIPETPVIEPTVFLPDYSSYIPSKDAAIAYLKKTLDESIYPLYVYKDFSDSANRFTQKAKIDDGHSDYVSDMNENWQEDPYSGSSAIEARVKTAGFSWGGWLFVNGYLPKGEEIPHLSFGEVPDAGLDLSGATELVFEAKGAQGGEIVEFFTAGLGYDGETDMRIATYADSNAKISLGFVTLTDQWSTYRIDLTDANLSSIGCGFGFVLSGVQSGDAESVFYLDDIRFEGPISQLEQAPAFLKSYETDTSQDPDQIYIQNAAFSYDNALVAMAFLSDGQQAEAAQILDAFVFAIENDRYLPGRVRNAYVYGDIRPFPGWESGARLPGWFDTEQDKYYEDQYQVGSNVGNTSFVAMAMLQYDKIYGEAHYRESAQMIMDWVIDNCSDDTPGFMAGYDGWPEGDTPMIVTHTYKSTEHNIDAYAVFKQLYILTGEEKYRLASESALKFIESMYDQEKGTFYTGTGTDGVTPSKENIVLDAQVWTLLSLGNENFVPYKNALSTALSMKTGEGGYPFHAENTNGGWWPEGTAFTALALRQNGMDVEAQSALDAMIKIQTENGAFPAASVKQLSTGFLLFTGEPWTYRNIPHIAPVAWYVMAVNGFNPYAYESW